MRSAIAAGLCVALSIALTGCRGNKAPPSPPPISQDQQARPLRPSALLGVYVGLFVAQNGFLPVNAAMRGIEAGFALFTVDPRQGMEETFALLQEFGSVLGENIPDLLNRSQERPQTLTLYLGGLRNITERAQRRKAELDSALEDLRGRERAASRSVSDIERSLREANDVRDYATAGGLQQERAKAEEEKAKLQSDIDRTQDVVRTFEDLIEIAGKRIEAIEKNREALVAGVEVVDVPGIEDLGLIRSGNPRQRERSGNFDFNDL